jgi:hypothetical protein
MKISIQHLLAATAALAVCGVRGGGPHDTNDDCWAVCQSVKGASKSAMTLSSPSCARITGDYCDKYCNW